MAGPVGVLRNRDPAEFWVTFWVTSAGSGETLAAVGTRPRLGAVNVDMEPCVRRRGDAPSPGA